jgi:phenylacetate 2-hydroxylase
VNLSKTLLENGENGGKHLDIYNNLRQIVFDLTLSLAYGAKSSGVDDSFTDSLVECIKKISAFRASTLRIRDYVTILRFLVPDFASGYAVAAAEKARQQHLDIIYASLKERLASGEKVSCLVSGLAQDKLSEPNIHGTCKALLQAAPDSTASSVYMAIA